MILLSGSLVLPFASTWHIFHSPVLGTCFVCRLLFWRDYVYLGQLCLSKRCSFFSYLYYYYYYYYLLQLNFHSVAVVLTLVTNKNLFIPQSFDWLSAFHVELLQAILSIAVYLSAPVFLATCFKYCSRGLPTAFFPNIAPSRMFTAKSLCLILCPIHEWRLFF